MKLKYGTNPHQQYASVDSIDPGRSPIALLNGTPSLINFLDALNAWQLVRELRSALALPAATSFKHVSPAGAAVAVPLDDDLRRAYQVDGRDLSPAAVAYVRARGADPKSSFGDFVGLSDKVDRATAEFMRSVVSDGIVAPGYDPDALEILKTKKSGGFIVMQANLDFEPPDREAREVFGMRLVQDRNNHQVTRADLANVKCGSITDEAARDLVLGLVTIKYTQSNSVGYAVGGQMIGIGAGQQSRIDCTKLAGAKADVWQLGLHPKVLGLDFKATVKRQERINWRVRYIEGDLTRPEERAFSDAVARAAEPLTQAEKAEFLATRRGVSLASDGFIPFRDNIDQASKHGVSFIAEPGGSTRDGDIEAACREHGIALVYTNLRLFHH